MRDPRDELEEDRPDAPSGLFFSRRGNWFHDGQRIRHERLAALLSRSVERDGTGQLIVTTGRDAVCFVAEDAPLIVRTVVVDAVGLRLRLSDETDEPLASDVVVDDVGQVRVAVRGRKFWALFSRAARQGLEPFVVDERHLVIASRTWMVVPAAGEQWSALP